MNIIDLSVCLASKGLFSPMNKSNTALVLTIKKMNELEIGVLCSISSSWLLELEEIGRYLCRNTIKNVCALL